MAAELARDRKRARDMLPQCVIAVDPAESRRMAVCVLDCRGAKARVIHWRVTDELGKGERAAAESERQLRKALRAARKAGLDPKASRVVMENQAAVCSRGVVQNMGAMRALCLRKGVAFLPCSAASKDKVVDGILQGAGNGKKYTRKERSVAAAQKWLDGNPGAADHAALLRWGDAIGGGPLASSGCIDLADALMIALDDVVRRGGGYEQAGV